MMNQTDENSAPTAEQPLPQAPAAADAQSAVPQVQIPSQEAFAPPMIQQQGNDNAQMPPQGAAPYLPFPPPYPPPPGVSVFAWRTRHFPRGTKWMFFYVYVRFILGFVLGAGSILSSLSTIAAAESYGIDESYVTLAKTLLVISALFYLFSLFVFNRLRKLGAGGYELLLIFLGVEVLMIAIDTAMNMNDYFYSSGWEIVTTALFALVIAGLCWFLPNYLYFRKRKDLFYDEPIH